MEKSDYYYFEPSTSGQSGLTALADALVKEAKEKHSYIVYSKDCIPQIVDELKERAEELKKENPRWKKMPKIYWYVNDYSGNASLHIDEWSFVLHKVKYIIHF